MKRIRTMTVITPSMDSVQLWTPQEGDIFVNTRHDLRRAGRGMRSSLKASIIAAISLNSPFEVVAKPSRFGFLGVLTLIFVRPIRSRYLTLPVHGLADGPA